jgi:hypothetical protein
VEGFEDRLVPAGLPGAETVAAADAAAPPAPAPATYRYEVRVPVNTPSTTIDVVTLLTNLGVDDMEERELSVTGNTNPGLVQAQAADDDLILRYTAGQTGTATIKVDAIDVAGMAVRLEVAVTVTPAPVVPAGRDTTLAPTSSIVTEIMLAVALDDDTDTANGFAA